MRRFRHANTQFSVEISLVTHTRSSEHSKTPQTSTNPQRSSNGTQQFAHLPLTTTLPPVPTFNVFSSGQHKHELALYQSRTLAPFAFFRCFFKRFFTSLFAWHSLPLSLVQHEPLAKFFTTLSGRHPSLRTEHTGSPTGRCTRSCTRSDSPRSGSRSLGAPNGVRSL